jgi:thymidylate synthase (FAD)
MEELLLKDFRVLDHGFVRVIDYMGDDSAVVQAARVSYGRGTKAANEDRGLIRYLLRHRHTTPFEMCEIKLHVKLPIFVARQWIRHRTANVNEYSARYSLLDKEFYLPAIEKLAEQSSTNKQGRGPTIDSAEGENILRILREDSERNFSNYEWLLNEDENGVRLDPNRRGLSRELARIGLSLNTYTQWYWKTDLHNFMNFLRLRADAHAQHEIRVYAERMIEILKSWVPFTYEAFKDYQLNAAHLSAGAIEVIRRRLKGEVVTLDSSGLTKREWDDLSLLFE